MNAAGIKDHVVSQMGSVAVVGGQRPKLWHLEDEVTPEATHERLFVLEREQGIRIPVTLTPRAFPCGHREVIYRVIVAYPSDIGYHVLADGDSKLIGDMFDGLVTSHADVNETRYDGPFRSEDDGFFTDTYVLAIDFTWSD